MFRHRTALPNCSLDFSRNEPRHDVGHAAGGERHRSPAPDGFGYADCACAGMPPVTPSASAPVMRLATICPHESCLFMSPACLRVLPRL